MRVTIDKGFHALVNKVMAQIQTTDPKLAVHHIIGSWAAGQTCPGLSLDSAQQAPLPDDEFSEIADWG